MKKIKTYIVFKEDPEQDTFEIYYVGRSKRVAIKVFRQRAFTFMFSNPKERVKLRFLTSKLYPFDYDLLEDNFDTQRYPNNIRRIVNSFWNSPDLVEYAMISGKTFTLDFLPYYVHKTKIDQVELPTVNKLLAEPSEHLCYWLKKYIKKHF